MPRRLKIKTHEVGDLELYVINQEEGSWEPEWKALQGHEVTNLLTTVSKETWDHALRGWTSPLVKTLGIRPEGALRKLPPESRECFDRKECPFYKRRNCGATLPKMPTCFEPGGFEEDEPRVLVANLVKLWREGVYILVVVDG